MPLKNRYWCPCGGDFEKKIDLFRHLCAMLGVKPYACPVAVCSYASVRASQTQLHVKHIHPGVTVHVCRENVDMFPVAPGSKHPRARSECHCLFLDSASLVKHKTLWHDGISAGTVVDPAVYSLYQGGLDIQSARQLGSIMDPSPSPPPITSNVLLASFPNYRPVLEQIYARKPPDWVALDVPIEHDQSSLGRKRPISSPSDDSDDEDFVVGQSASPSKRSPSKRSANSSVTGRGMHDDNSSTLAIESLVRRVMEDVLRESAHVRTPRRGCSVVIDSPTNSIVESSSSRRPSVEPSRWPASATPPSPSPGSSQPYSAVRHSTAPSVPLTSPFEPFPSTTGPHGHDPDHDPGHEHPNSSTAPLPLALEEPSFRHLPSDQAFNIFKTQAVNTSTPLSRTYQERHHDFLYGGATPWRPPFQARVTCDPAVVVAQCGGSARE